MNVSDTVTHPSEASAGAFNWFQLSVSYQGYGRAEFEDPEGYIEGPVVVRFDESGLARAIMEVKSHGSVEPLAHGPLQLVTAERPTQQGDSATFSVGPGAKPNRCRHLVVATDNGAFKSENLVSYGHTVAGVFSLAFRQELAFRLFRGAFTPNNPAPARYWALPLTNFISDFLSAGGCIVNHPLRLRRASPNREGLSDQDRIIAEIGANNMNRMIVFNYRGLPAFIDPLLDYDERQRRLKEGIGVWSLPSWSESSRLTCRLRNKRKSCCPGTYSFCSHWLPKPRWALRGLNFEMNRVTSSLAGTLNVASHSSRKVIAPLMRLSTTVSVDSERV
jgi:hypothetical protein